MQASQPWWQPRRPTINCHNSKEFRPYNTDEFICLPDKLYEKIDDPSWTMLVSVTRACLRQWFVDKKLIQEFVPQSSPMLNPIEECFFEIHHLICLARVWTPSALIAAVDDAFPKVTAENRPGWYDPTTVEYRNQCLRKQPILTKANPDCPEFDLAEVDEDEEDDLSVYSLDEIAVISWLSPKERKFFYLFAKTSTSHYARHSVDWLKEQKVNFSGKTTEIEPLTNRCANINRWKLI